MFRTPFVGHTAARAWGSILHVSDLDKFIPPFIDLVRDEFPCSRNFFYVVGEGKIYSELAGTDSVLQKPRKASYWRLLLHMMIARRVVLHSLHSQVAVLLAMNPWLPKKCYWMIWGGDLYRYQRPAVGLRGRLVEMSRRLTIRRLGNLVTYVPGDVELARGWYGARGRHIECLMYPSNLYKALQVPERRAAKRTLLVGNSATPSNRHEYVFGLLSSLRLEGWRIVVPLSYGETAYADKISSLGLKLFGERFEPLREFLPLEQYLKLLSEVDIGVFAHDRQQGMGNIITLLGMGKTIYMDPEVSSFELLAGKGIEVKSVHDLTLTTLSPEIARQNERAVSDYFSRERLVEQLAQFCT